MVESEIIQIVTKDEKGKVLSEKDVQLKYPDFTTERKLQDLYMEYSQDIADGKKPTQLKIWERSAIVFKAVTDYSNDDIRGFSIQECIQIMSLIGEKLFGKKKSQKSPSSWMCGITLKARTKNVVNTHTRVFTR